MKLGHVALSLALSLAWVSTAQEAKKPAPAKPEAAKAVPPKPEAPKPEAPKPAAPKAESAKPAALMERVADLMRQNEELRNKVSEATQKVRLAQQKARQREAEFSKPYDAKRVAELERRLEQQRDYVTRLETELAAAKVESQKDRDAKKAEAKADVSKATKAYQEAAAPFNKERAALFREAKPVSDALADLFATVVRKPEGLGIANTVVSANAWDGFCSVSWLDAEKKRLAWAHLRLRRIPPNMHSEAKVAGKYPIQTLSATNCWFWVEGVNVAFIVDKQEWQGKDKLPKMAAQLLDLDALAALPKPKQAE